MHTICLYFDKMAIYGPSTLFEVRTTLSSQPRAKESALVENTSGN
jgi:hypothetical protein